MDNLVFIDEFRSADQRQEIATRFRCNSMIRVMEMLGRLSEHRRK